MTITINEIQYPTTRLEMVRRPNTPILILSVYETIDDLLNIEHQNVNIVCNNTNIVTDFYVDFIYKDEINNKITFTGEEK